MVKKVVNVLTTILLIVLIALVIVVFISRIKNESPSVFGYHIFQVTTGSMEPELMIGDVILDKEVDPSEINVGDIITYRGSKGDLANKMITHKVIRKNLMDDGKYTFVTQGTAKGTIEDPEFDESHIVGKYQCKIPFLDKVYTFFLSDYGLIVFVGIIVLLFAYEIISMIFSYKSIEEDIDDEYQKNKYKNDNDDNDMYKPL